MPRKRGSGRPNKIVSGLVLATLGFGIIGAMSEKDRSSTHLTQATEPLSSAPSPPPLKEAVSGARALPDVAHSDDAAPPTSSAQDVTRYVRGSKSRSSRWSRKAVRILDRYDSGRVFVSELKWLVEGSRQADREEGWILASLLSQTKRGEDTAPAKRGNDEPSHDAGDKDPEPHVPQISESAVVQRIIAESLSMYPGSCACPYNADRGGRRCRKRSAYNRGGGYAPICFGRRLEEMIQSFRQHASRD